VADGRTLPAVPYRDPKQLRELSGRLAGRNPRSHLGTSSTISTNRPRHPPTGSGRIWEQTGGRLWCLGVSATGTGGTYGGGALSQGSVSRVRCVSPIPWQRPPQLATAGELKAEEADHEGSATAASPANWRGSGG